MARKPPPANRVVEPPEIDDLKRIKGIRQAVESRLHDHGIFTFAKLATLLPADIAAAVAGLPGMTAERIIREDWIGQARRLAEGSIPTEPQQVAEIPEVVPPVVGEPELSASAAEVNKPVPPVIAPPGAKEAEITLPVVAMTVPVGGVLCLGDMEVVSAEAQRPPNFLRHGQPFDVRLTLDLSEVVAPESIQLSYKVSIYGNSLEGHPRQAVGEASGIITPADRVAVNVIGTAPPEGIYRLQAVVTVGPATIEPIPNRGLMATMEGTPLLIM